LPVPVAPEVTVTQGTLLAAVQGQVDATETVALPVPPADPTLWLVGVTTNVQLAGGGAVCVTVKV